MSDMVTVHSQIHLYSIAIYMYMYVCKNTIVCKKKKKTTTTKKLKYFYSVFDFV